MSWQLGTEDSRNGTKSRSWQSILWTSKSYPEQTYTLRVALELLLWGSLSLAPGHWTWLLGRLNASHRRHHIDK